jgi:hypothetical protein
MIPASFDAWPRPSKSSQPKTRVMTKYSSRIGTVGDPASPRVSEKIRRSRPPHRVLERYKQQTAWFAARRDGASWTERGPVAGAPADTAIRVTGRRAPAGPRQDAVASARLPPRSLSDGAPRRGHLRPAAATGQPARRGRPRTRRPGVRPRADQVRHCGSSPHGTICDAPFPFGAAIRESKLLFGSGLPAEPGGPGDPSWSSTCLCAGEEHIK